MSDFDWAAPDARVDLPGVGPSVETIDAAPAVERSELPELIPRTPTQVADGGFAFVCRHPRAALGIAAVFTVPFAILTAYLQRDILGGQSFSEVFQSNDPSVVGADSGSGSSTFAGIVANIGPTIALVFIAYVFAVLITAERTGQPFEPGAAVRAALVRTPAVFVCWLLVHLAETLGALAFIVGAIFVMSMFVVTIPVLAIERIGPIASMRRAARLSNKRRGAVIGTALLTGLVAYVASQALALLPVFIAGIIGFDIGWIIVGVGTAFIEMLTKAFVAAAAVELYFDLRVRHEALDIELQIPQLFAEAG